MNNRTIKVTVLMPSYNEERYVQEALDSVLAQTFTDFELIVVDDGSTDGTRAIVASYAQRDPRILLVENGRNRGLVYSLNRGLQLARGKYVARLDANDVSLPQRLARQVAYLERCSDVGVLGTNMAYIDAEGELLHGGRPKDWRPLSPTLIRWMLLWRCAIYHTTVILRRTLLERTGFTYDPNYRHAEDRDLWTRLAPHTVIAALPDVLVHCRLLATGVSQEFNKEQRAQGHAITRRELTKLVGRVPSKEAKETLISVFSGHNRGANCDFTGAADLLVGAYRRFCARPLSQTDERRVERDVARRLLVIGRQAALQSPQTAFAVMQRLRHLSPYALLSIEVGRGIAGVLLRIAGLRPAPRSRLSQAASGGESD